MIIVIVPNIKSDTHIPNTIYSYSDGTSLNNIIRINKTIEIAPNEMGLIKSQFIKYIYRFIFIIFIKNVKLRLI